MPPVLNLLTGDIMSAKRSAVIGELLEFYNPYHDSRGRFASKGNAAVIVRPVQGGFTKKLSNGMRVAGATISSGVGSGLLTAFGIGMKSLAAGTAVTGWAGAAVLTSAAIGAYKGYKSKKKELAMRDLLERSTLYVEPLPTG